MHTAILPLIFYVNHSKTSTEAARLSFNGNQYMRVTVPVNSQSKVEDIFVRFRTRFPDGLIAATSSDSVIDMLMVELVRGVIRVRTNYGLGQTKITAGRSLDDNKWHAVHVQRQDERLMVTVDNTDRAEGNAKSIVHLSLTKNIYS